jgi:phosphoserine aminotransferase
VPDDYRIGIVPASDTGAVEMAMWSMLGAAACDMVAWESFGAGWVTDVVKQLKLDDVRQDGAEYGEIAGSCDGRFRHATWSSPGTAPPRGVRVPNGDFIPADRAGLTICDATSRPLRRTSISDKLDVTPSPGRRCWAARRRMAC